MPTDSHNPNIATDTPDIGVFVAWGGPEWMRWYFTLVGAYGVDRARQIWIDAWNTQGQFDYAYNWLRYDSDFAHFLENNGLGGRTPDSKIIVGTKDVISDVVDAATTSAKILKYAIPVLLIGGLIIVGSIAVRESKKVKL